MNKKIVPLSPNQKVIWFDQMVYPGIPLYNIGGYVSIKGNIDPVIFDLAVNRVINTNDALRIKIHEINGEPYQEFAAELSYRCPSRDFSGEKEPHKSCMNWMQEEFEKPIAINDFPLFRFFLVKEQDGQFYWFAKWHHIIIDGWGVSLNAQRLADAYNRLTGGHSFDTGVMYSYRDFLQEELDYLHSEAFQIDKDYWKQTFNTPPGPLVTGKTQPAGAKKIKPGSRKTIVLKRDFYNRLNQLAGENRVSLFHLFLGALFTYFGRIYNKEDFVIGVPILNRRTLQAKKTIGLYTGILPLRAGFNNHMTFSRLLQIIRGQLRADYRYQRLSIDEINKNLNGLQIDRKQLYDISLSYEKHNYEISFGGYPSRTITLSNRHLQNPLAVFVREFDGSRDVDVNFDYNPVFFDRWEIRQISGHIKCLLEEVVKNPGIPLRDIDFLAKKEKRKLLVELNDTGSSCPKNKTIIDLFENQVAKTPGHTALVFQDYQLTYRELDKRANQLAHYLIHRHHIRCNDIVGILMERCERMIIALAAVLKAGGAFLPIDADYHEQRVTFMLEDSAARLLLTNLPSAEKNAYFGDVLNIAGRDFNRGPGINIYPATARRPADPLYIIYTSGSTGKSKGVVIRHFNLVNYICWAKDLMGLCTGDRTLLLHSFGFDGHLTNLFGALLTGHTLEIPSRSLLLDPDGLAHYINSHAVTYFKAIPPLFSLLVNSRLFRRGAAMKNLRLVMLGGEAINVSSVEQFRETCSWVKIINHYGPTETTVGSTALYIDFNRFIAFKRRPTIGKPAYNTRVYILDGSQNLQPLYAAGELCISGHGLAAGYLNRPELTAEKFIAFSREGHKKERGTTLYKTGDLARWRRDGNIEFLGRIDDQVKIRGYRIEPEEIRCHLSTHPGIKEAVVTIGGPGANREELAAYVVIHQQTKGENINAIELRRYLEKLLPGYMIPSYFIFLGHLPLTANGKVDKKALPLPDASALPLDSEYEAPGSVLEKKLAVIWQDILAKERVGIRDNFFQLGGHSLKATRMASRIRRDLSLEVNLRDIFTSPTIAGLSGFLKLKERPAAGFTAVEPVEKREFYGVSHAQWRLWVLDRLEPGSAVYNMPAAYIFKGRLDIASLERAFSSLIERHESLRTLFISPGGKPLQVVRGSLGFAIHRGRAGSEPDREASIGSRAREFALTPFDLTGGPLVKVQLITLSEQKYLFLFNMHHIVSDGWSLNVFVKELLILYRAYCRGKADPLPPPRIQYKDYTAWQDKILKSAGVKKLRDYWHKKLSGRPPTLHLPTDYPRPAVNGHNGNRAGFTLDRKFTGPLNQLSQSRDCSLFMILLSLIKVMLYRYTGEEDIIIGTPTAGREHADLENQVGFYVNTLAIRDRVTPGKSFLSFLDQVKQNTMDAYEHQLYPFDKLVDELDIKRDPGHHPLFDVMVVLQNNPRFELSF